MTRPRGYVRASEKATRLPPLRWADFQTPRSISGVRLLLLVKLFTFFERVKMFPGTILLRKPFIFSRVYSGGKT